MTPWHASCSLPLTTSNHLIRGHLMRTKQGCFLSLLGILALCTTTKSATAASNTCPAGKKAECIVSYQDEGFKNASYLPEGTGVSFSYGPNKKYSADLYVTGINKSQCNLEYKICKNKCSTKTATLSRGQSIPVSAKMNQLGLIGIVCGNHSPGEPYPAKVVTPPPPPPPPAPNEEDPLVDTSKKKFSQVCEPVKGVETLPTCRLSFEDDTSKEVWDITPMNGGDFLYAETYGKIKINAMMEITDDSCRFSIFCDKGAGCPLWGEGNGDGLNPDTKKKYDYNLDKKMAVGESWNFLKGGKLTVEKTFCGVYDHDLVSNSAMSYPECTPEQKPVCIYQVNEQVVEIPVGESKEFTKANSFKMVINPTKYTSGNDKDPGCFTWFNQFKDGVGEDSEPKMISVGTDYFSTSFPKDSKINGEFEIEGMGGKCIDACPEIQFLCTEDKKGSIKMILDQATCQPTTSSWISCPKGCGDDGQCLP